MTFSEAVSASMYAGRLNSRSAYFISGAACLPSWMPYVVETPQQRRDGHVEHRELLAQHVLLLGEHRCNLGQCVIG